MKKIRVYIIIALISLLVFQLLLVLCSCNTSNKKTDGSASKAVSGANISSSETNAKIFGTDENGIKIEYGDLPIMSEN
ncbi:MAG: hypothetical protein KBS62_02440 [Oscillospiraceae bacterium]|nr:hypothetical protein [Candidatus Ruminococcus equi]